MPARSNHGMVLRTRNSAPILATPLKKTRAPKAIAKKQATRREKTPTCTLDTLPSDVILRIINIGSESFDAMSGISRRWRNICTDVRRTELAKLPGPPIKQFELTIEKDLACVRMDVPAAAQKWLGINPKHAEDNDVTFECSVRKTEDKQRLADFLARTFAHCSRIEVMAIDVAKPSEIELIANAAHGIEIGHLEIEGFELLKNQIADPILKIIVNNSVRFLRINAERMSLSLKDFVCVAAPKVPKIEIKVLPRNNNKRSLPIEFQEEKEWLNTNRPDIRMSVNSVYSMHNYARTTINVFRTV